MQLGVLISGRGSNLEAILDAIGAGELAASVELVLSNKAEAGGLAKASEHGVPTRVVRHADFPSREAFDAELVRTLREANVDFVVLAGFMRIVTPVLLDAFPRRVLNIHPSLLPAFPGVDAQAQALAHRVRITGCTVHLVDSGTDTGPIVAQASVPVLDEDTRDTLAARILVAEHRLLVHVLGLFAAGKVAIDEAGAGRPAVRVPGEKLSFGPGELP